MSTRKQKQKVSLVFKDFVVSPKEIDFPRVVSAIDANDAISRYRSLYFSDILDNFNFEVNEKDS